MNKQKPNGDQHENLKYEFIQKVQDQFKNQVPIRRGCANGNCFCTGKCHEIIGWRDRLPEEQYPLKGFQQQGKDQSQEDLLNRLKNLDEEKSHFEDIEPVNTCRHPSHNPPTHLHIPQGKRYVHVCPACKQRQVIQPLQITF